MGFRLTPQENSFYDLFAKSASYLVLGSRELTTLLGVAHSEREAVATRMREIEHQADEATHEIIRKVNSSFITPFDREDIHGLASTLDDCMDMMDAAVDHPGRPPGEPVRPLSRPVANGDPDRSSRTRGIRHD